MKNNSKISINIFSLLIMLCGFTTVLKAQAINSFTPANGSIGTLVTVSGTGLNNPSTFTIGGVAAIVISNTGSSLVAMVMPGTTTGLVSINTGSGAVNSSTNFTVVASKVPTTQEGNKLVGNGNTGPAQQGTSVAISADGNTAIVGGNSDNTYQGAAWIYTKSGGVWSQQGNKLVGTGSIGVAYQGASVAISADGNTVIVGGYADNAHQGAAWIFTRTSGVWSQQGNKLVGTGNLFEAYQGSSVSLSADGNTAIVGGKNDNSGQGATWVFTRTGTVWSQQGNKLVGTGNAGGAEQGFSVSVSADGNTAIVGGPTDNSYIGATWVFTRTGNVWSQQGNKLVGTGGIGGAQQGYSVGLSADGNTTIIGAAGDNSDNGAAWIFTRTSGVWNQQGNKLIGTNNIGVASFGCSASISADGNTVIVGGLSDNTGHGAAWVYTRTGGVWSQQTNKLIGSGNVGAAKQGTSVALSADGNTAFVGGNFDNNQLGAAWVYTLPLPPSITSFTPSSGPVGTIVTITGTNLNNPLSFTIGGITAIIVSNTGSSLVALVMPGATTGLLSINNGSGVVNSNTNFTIVTTQPPNTQQGNKLVGTGNTGFAYQGTSVALNADGNTAIVGGNYDNNQIGASWIYIRTGSVWSQQGNKLVGTGNNGASYQGTSVAISADGNTAIVGGYKDNFNQGAVWIFTRSGSVWSQQGNKLVGIGNIGAAYQGTSVAISADGNTAIVGGNGDNFTLGAVWIFTRTAGVWSQQGNKLVGTGNIGAAIQGNSVSMSADGKTIIVGGPGDNNQQGAAWVYTRTGSVWSQQGNKLIGTGNTGDANQGNAVSISADGNTAIVGGYQDNNQQGAIWVYTRTAGVWSQQGNKLIATGNIGAAWQGNSVSLSADGNTVLAGGNSDNSSQGASWVFTRTGSTWSQQGSKLVGNGSIGSANQGNHVALSADGNTALAGGIYDNSSRGAAWVFISNIPLATKFISLTATQKAADVFINFSTTNEIETNNYIVEESNNGIEFITGNNITAQNLSYNNYSCIAKHVVDGNNYYRIKAIDKNGKTNYSQVIKLTIGKNKFAAFNVYPNPIEDGLIQVQLNNLPKGEYTLRVISIAGNEQFSKKIIHGGGSSIQSYYIGKFNKGLYNIQLVSNEVLLTKKVIAN